MVPEVVDVPEGVVVPPKGVEVRYLSEWKYLRVWRKAESPSMRQRMLTVRTAQKAKMSQRTIPPYQWVI